jgi:hypothetical protein
MHTYEVHPRKDKRSVDLICDALPFGRLWYDALDNAIGYATHSSRSHHAVIRDAGFVTSRVLNRNVKVTILSAPALHGSPSFLAPPLLSAVCL